MRPSRSVLAAGVLLALGAGLVGCSRTATYEDSTACSMTTDEVAAMLDTDRFTADRFVPDLPESLEETGYVEPRVCFADGGGSRVRVRVDIVGSSEVERLQTQVQEGASVKLGEGRAGIGSSRTVWACGAIVVALDVYNDDRSEQISVDDETMQAAITDLAEGVGCPLYEGL